MVHGFKVRFDTQLLSFVEDKDTVKIVCLVQDRVSGQQYNIHTRYLFGADGDRSVVVEQLHLPMTVMASGGPAWNVRVRANLLHNMQFREGDLHCILRLEKDCTHMVVGRMVKHWDDWMFVFFPKGPGVPAITRSKEGWEEMVNDVIGDPSVAVKMLRIDRWIVNETSADVISKGNV